MGKLTKDELYWQKRNEELEAKWFEKSQKEIEKELAAYYAQALKHIEKDINSLYARFAFDNEMDMLEAQRLLQGKEFQVWRMDIQEYLKEIEKTNSRKLLTELNTLAMRSRITRLDMLKAETYVELSKLAEKFGKSMDKFLPKAYEDFYYRNLFEIGKKRGLDSIPVKVDSKKLSDVLRTPWSGKNYSDRIWANQEKLAKVLNNEVVSAMHRGSSIDKVSQIVTQKLNVGMSNARRLVRTELNYVGNRAALDSIKDSGMKYYRFIATLDRRTSTVCREHDGKIYPVEDGSPGTNMPPLHPRCRSTIAGSIKKDSVPKGSRVARGDDGETYKIPADMTYEQWYNKYIDLQPTGKSEWKVKDNGSLIPTKVIPKGTHWSPPAKASPNEVVMHYGAGGQHDYDLYDSSGFACKQIHCGNHGNPKRHPFHNNGAHAVDWQWENVEGKWKRTRGENRELTDVERVLVHDSLKI